MRRSRRVAIGRPASSSDLPDQPNFKEAIGRSAALLLSVCANSANNGRRRYPNSDMSAPMAPELRRVLWYRAELDVLRQGREVDRYCDYKRRTGDESLHATRMLRQTLHTLTQ